MESNCLLFEYWLHHLQTLAHLKSCFPETTSSLSCFFLMVGHYLFTVPARLFPSGSLALAPRCSSRGNLILLNTDWLRGELMMRYGQCTTRRVYCGTFTPEDFLGGEKDIPHYSLHLLDVFWVSVRPGAMVLTT